MKFMNEKLGKFYEIKIAKHLTIVNIILEILFTILRNKLGKK